MKIPITTRILLLATLSLIPMQLRSDTCPGCDCTHFPVTDPKCESCCFAQKGTITSASSDSATLAPIAGKEQPPKTFKITHSTKINGQLKQGAVATIYYHKSDEGNVATRIDGLGYSYGSLIPGNLPTPPDTCERVWRNLRRLRESEPRPTPGPLASLPSRMPPNAMRVFLGNSEAYSTDGRLVVFKSGDDDLIVLQRTETGMFVSAKVRDRDGGLVAQIVDNQFFINPHDSYKISGAGTNSLIVKDSTGDRLLDVQFVNPLTVRILGTFFGLTGDKISIGEDQQVFESSLGSNFSSSENCFGGGPAGLIELHANGAITVN